MIETLLQTTLSPAALGTGLFLLLAYFANFIFQQQKNDGKTFKLSTAPWLGNRSMMDMREAVITGYEKVSRVPTIPLLRTMNLESKDEYLS
jgi:hypothetical protein